MGSEMCIRDRDVDELIMVLVVVPLAVVVFVVWKRGCNATPAYASSCIRISLLISRARPVEWGRSRSWIRIVANWSGVMSVSWRFQRKVSFSRKGSVGSGWLYAGNEGLI